MIVDYTSGSGNATYTYTGSLPYPALIAFINDGAADATITINDVPAITVKSGEQLMETFEGFDTVKVAATSAWRMLIGR